MSALTPAPETGPAWPSLCWPARPLDVRTTARGALQVYDLLRRRLVACTPEEWVRQQLVHHLVFDRHFPAPLLAVERGLRYNGRLKRFDLLAFGPGGTPLLLAECKAPGVALKPAALHQLALYNARYAAPHLLITNGRALHLFSFRFGGGYAHRADLPTHAELLAQ